MTSEIRINAPYWLTKQGIKLKVTTREIITPVVVAVVDGRGNTLKVNISQLTKVNNYNYV